MAETINYGIDIMPLKSYGGDSTVEFDAINLADGNPALCYTSSDGTCAITIEGDKNNREQTCLCVMLFDAGVRSTFVKIFDDVICAIGIGQSIAEISSIKGFDEIVNACKKYDLDSSRYEEVDGFHFYQEIFPE